MRLALVLVVGVFLVLSQLDGHLAELRSGASGGYTVNSLGGLTFDLHGLRGTAKDVRCVWFGRDGCATTNTTVATRAAAASLAIDSVVFIPAYVALMWLIYSPNA